MPSSGNLRSTAIAWLNSLREAGLHDLPASADHDSDRRVIPADGVDNPAAAPASRVAEPVSPWRTEPVAAVPPAPERPPPPIPGDAGYGTTLDHAARTAQLQRLQQAVATCTRCPELARCRTQTVFGVGPSSPRLCFFGEAPGADEDRLGEPFVGRAGELLNRIIAACHMSRADVYILNTIKCRPPGNRNPVDGEIANCREYFEQQLEILQPEFICCLGSVAARTLLETRDSIGRLRGRFHRYRGSRVVVTYHPAYLLRTPAAKVRTWEDMQMLMQAMGIDR